MHEQSRTMTVTDENGRKLFVNVDKKGNILGGRFFRTLDDAVIEAQSRSTFAKSDTPRNPAARKNPRDKNKPRNARTVVDLFSK